MSVLDPLFNKAAVLQAATQVTQETPTQMTPRQVFFYEYCEIFKNSFLNKKLLVATSEVHVKKPATLLKFTTLQVFFKEFG